MVKTAVQAPARTEIKLVVPVPEWSAPDSEQRFLNDVVTALVGKLPPSTTRAGLRCALDRACAAWAIPEA